MKIMRQLIAHIECNKSGLFSVYVDSDMPFGIIGEGRTAEEAKENFLAVYEEMRLDHQERTGECVEFSFSFTLDASAFLQKYKGILTLSGLSHVTGINKGQLSQYLCGRRNPSDKTQAKIKKAVQAFAMELSQALS